MRHSKQFPNTIRELERLIKRHIVKKGESQQEEDETVRQVLTRMNMKSMFTPKTRTGEAREHAKEPKLKSTNILEIYKKEKGEIPIVFESSYAQTKNPM
jgi:transcriptional regulator with GAF, ATPase, and Fis domain